MGGSSHGVSLLVILLAEEIWLSHLRLVVYPTLIVFNTSQVVKVGSSLFKTTCFCWDVSWNPRERPKQLRGMGGPTVVSLGENIISSQSGENHLKSRDHPAIGLALGICDFFFTVPGGDFRGFWYCGSSFQCLRSILYKCG